MKKKRGEEKFYSLLLVCPECNGEVKFTDVGFSVKGGVKVEAVCPECEIPLNIIVPWEEAVGMCVETESGLGLTVQQGTSFLQ